MTTLFTSLNRAPGSTWSDATKRKAPHKPFLLLAVLDLVHRGIIISPFTAACRNTASLKRAGRAAYGETDSVILTTECTEGHGNESDL